MLSVKWSVIIWYYCHPISIIDVLRYFEIYQVEFGRITEENTTPSGKDAEYSIYVMYGMVDGGYYDQK